MNPTPHTPWDRSNERGSYALLSGILIASLVGLSAFSVDVSLITMAELQAQATADAASHAALVAFRRGGGSTSAGNTAATWIVNRNQVAMGTANLDNVTFGQWNYTANAFTPGNTRINAASATVSRKALNGNAVQLLLAPILGVYTYDVDATSITAEQLRAIMLVMDMSCSMMGRADQWQNTSLPVNVGRVANVGFLDYLVANPQDGDLLGLSMFAQYANRTPDGTNPGGTRISPGDYIPQRVPDPPWLPLTDIESQQALIRQRINGICSTQVTSNCVAGANHPTTSVVGSYTNPGPAIYQGVNELTDTAKVNATYFKGIVFFSDGQPCMEDGCGGAASAAAATRGNQAASAAWANDIYVWTIYYAHGGGTAGTRSYMEGLVRGAPTAFAQTSQQVADLPAMYQTVAKSLPTAVVY
jgi:hypothetical protein